MLGHTLMPYYLRFYPRQKKQMVFQTLLCGKSSGITSIDLLGMEREEGLQYCPICYQEDVQQFGEPFGIVNIKFLLCHSVISTKFHLLEYL